MLGSASCHDNTPGPMAKCQGRTVLETPRFLRESVSRVGSLLLAHKRCLLAACSWDLCLSFRGESGCPGVSSYMTLILWEEAPPL